MASWFYLTLWNGSPDEFTDKFDVEITKGEELGADVRTSDGIGAEPCKASPFHVRIERNHDADANVETRTGVTWNVRRAD